VSADTAGAPALTDRERARRARLHRTIEALSAKLDTMGSPVTARERRKWFRLRSKIRRLHAKLAQPELPL
jgi:hypothetical protein